LIFLIVFFTIGLTALSRKSPNGFAKMAAVVATVAIVAVVATAGAPGR
tara:strand:- start:794 stop:937 length:144 start_codon:yes stop_codon:yes gene_type:complete